MKPIPQSLVEQARQISRQGPRSPQAHYLEMLVGEIDRLNRELEEQQAPRPDPKPVRVLTGLAAINAQLLCMRKRGGR